jgi:ssDNA-binding replication factor A large subunit
MPEFKVKDLKPQLGDVTIELEIVSMGEPRAFNSFKGQGTVTNAAVKDETGEVSLTLWGEQYKGIHDGDVIKIEKGYVTEYKGKLQISTGKFGILSVIKKGEGKEKEEEQ